MGVPNPINHAAEAQRVLFTFIGVAIGTLTTLLANLLGKRAAKQPGSRSPRFTARIGAVSHDRRFASPSLIGANGFAIGSGS